MVSGKDDGRQRVSAEALAGLKIFIDGKSYLTLAGGPGYAPGFQTATARGVIGFVFEPSVGDRDGDGIPDNEDACPDEPGPPNKDPRKNGCPIRDRDGDGVPDDEDNCPDEPGPAINHGCPLVDTDGDGIPDIYDKCPTVPGLKQFQGCPDPDRDHDGVPNSEDLCPDVPGPASNHGCPEKSIVVTETGILIVDKIQFETGSATILPTSYGVIDDVAKTLADHPEFTLVEVQGHADERGSDKLNLQLTQARAQSVMNALVARGIARTRLRPAGYGPYCPLDPESNAKAWETNRRVEFKIVRNNGAPTGAVLGCSKAEANGIHPEP
jgi:outer membrane protein OmpA-like peptidoglycan-associated protein